MSDEVSVVAEQVARQCVECRADLVFELERQYRIGAGPAPDARASVFIQSDTDKALLPVLRDVPFTKLLNNPSRSALRPCG